MRRRNKKAFTIIEIISALVIIGVIAVFTMPSIISYSNALQAKTALKKACNTLISAVGMVTSVNYTFMTPDDDTKLMDIINSKMNIKYYLNCASGNCEKVFQNPQVGFWAINDDNIGFQVEKGSSNCADTITINTAESASAAKDMTCLSVLIDANCIAKAKTSSSCQMIPDDKDKISSNFFEGTQIRVFMSKDGIATGNPDNTAGGIIMAE